MISKEYAQSCAEVNEVLKYINENELNKIPKELRDIFDKFQSKDYISPIMSNNSLNIQQLNKQTKKILVALYVKYWCKEEDKKEVNKILKENYEKKQLKLKEKYNPDNIFKVKTNKRNFSQENKLEIVNYNQCFWRKILKKIGKFFNIKKEN